MLAAQGGAAGAVGVSPQAGARPDSSSAAAAVAAPDSASDRRAQSERVAREARRQALRASRTVALTRALLASAFDGDPTRSLIALARAARSADDSAIHRYDATSVSRLTVKLSIGSLARDRVLLRQERTERVRWQRGLGAIVEVTGARTAFPMLPSARDEADDDDAISLPFVPGRRTLSLGGERTADTTAYTDIDDIIDPLAPGAEAYYRYTAGDSETIRAAGQGGGQQIIRLREVRLHARRPIWNLGTGSLWFDASNGHLVRAVYRFSAPMDIVVVAKDADPHAFDDVPFWVKPMITPMTATLSAVTIEYNLLEGRYWMPVSRYADGEARVSAMRLPVRWEVRYRYSAVNGADTLPRLPELVDTVPSRHSESSAESSGAAVGPPSAAGAQSSGSTTSSLSPSPPPHAAAAQTAAGGAGSLVRDSAQNNRGSAKLAMRSGASRSHMSDSARKSSRDSQCAQQTTWERVEVHDGGAARVLVSTPCDTAALARSPDLPGSIYGDDDAQFGTLDEQSLLKALGSSPAPDWSPQPIALLWGPHDGLIRYNRIEGLSAGIAVTDELGLGLSARGEARLGVADLEPNGGLSLTRTNPWGTVTASNYRRLVSVNDWGDPLSFGSSVWNFLVGDDEGFYYRSWGGELTGTETTGPLPYSWRLFTEQEWTASAATHFAITGVFGGASMPLRNINARAGALTGLSFRARPTWGLDPDGFQLSADFRGEGAGGSYSYVRGATDITVTHPVTAFADGALTLGGGTSAGDVPPQRLWYLGGLRTIRGLAPGTDVGDAYWMTHLELTTRAMLIRPVVFYDLGWAGDRGAWSHEGRALNGAGVGASILDGLVRVDIGKGIWPTHSVRVNAYMQGAF